MDRKEFADKVYNITGILLNDIPWSDGHSSDYQVISMDNLSVVKSDSGFRKIDISEEDFGPCGYCGAKDGDICDCNGYGGPKGLSHADQEYVCGYCQYEMYVTVKDPFKRYHYVTSQQPCSCDGWGEYCDEYKHIRMSQCKSCGCSVTISPQRGDKICPACGAPVSN
jgi:hypothetical protein